MEQSPGSNAAGLRLVRIAQIAPLYEAVPPKLYGGTERVVAYLADALVDLGHDVTLFAAGDSRSRAQLIATRDQSIRLDTARLKSDLAAHLVLLHEVRRLSAQFDILHFHIDMTHFPLFESHASRTVTTLHGRLDLKDLPGVYERWPAFGLVSISASQREPLPNATWLATVGHGVPLDLHRFQEHPSGTYLAFLGRLSPEKRPDLAIELASRAHQVLKIAGKVDPVDATYFETVVKPLIDHNPLVEFVGEIGDDSKSEFLGNAQALLFPICWPEPFGLVMIEAMACGTPVIAWDCGAVPEVIEHGVTGVIVHSMQEALAGIELLPQFDRRRIRARFEQRFSASIMARSYLEVYARLLGDSPSPTHRKPGRGRSMSLSDDPRERRGLLPRFTLKHGNTFLLADALGDVQGTEDGLFTNDTRMLSHLELAVAGRAPSLLGAAISQDDTVFTAHLTNRPLPALGEGSIPQGVIHIERSRFLWEDRLHERIRFTNFSEYDTRVPLTLRFAADFVDIFEVQGHVRQQRGVSVPALVNASAVQLAYRGRDDVLRTTQIRFSRPPVAVSSGEAEFVLELARGKTGELFIEVGAAGDECPSAEQFARALGRASADMQTRFRAGASISTSAPLFNQWINKSRSDLALLTTPLPTGPYPYAGIPWFATQFGRDAIITSLQTLWLNPTLAAGVLRFLASMQSTEDSAFRDSQPGKIMHETRRGEMAALCEVPFGCYYGGVDTTPLFVMLAGEYERHTADRSLVDEIWSQLLAATAWIERRLDSSSTGFLDYARGKETGLANQAWKDSHDSMFHADGRFPPGPLAVVEVQGYAYAALRAMAELGGARNDWRCAGWDARADRLRAAIERHFWVPALDFYALALDGEGKPCCALGSNAGHLLYCGVPSEGARGARDRAADVEPILHRVGDPHARRRRGALQSDVVPQRLDLAT